MPKRMLDDSFLSSPSLAKCSPRAQDAFPRFILLADDFGCFDAVPRILLAKGWPYRTDVTEAELAGWLEEYVAAGMAVMWTEAERRYCYLTGWNGPHGQRKRVEYDPNAAKGTAGAHGSKRRTPPPPEELVVAVIAGARREVDGKPPGTARESTGKDDPENLSNTVPAREIEVSRQSPAQFPRISAAPAAVPVAVPAAAAAGSSPAPRLLPPRLKAFQLAISEALGVTRPIPVAKASDVWAVADELELLLAAHSGADPEALVSACVTHALSCGTTPRALAWFVKFLRDLPPAGTAPRRGPDECPKPGDPDFGDPDAWPSYEAFLARDGRLHA